MGDKQTALFDQNAFDRTKYLQVMRRPKSEIIYIIYFTPRSGSGYLADLCQKSGRLGRPGEPFNRNFVPNIAKRAGVANIEQYVQSLLRKKNRRTFGFEITWGQLRRTFGSADRFLTFFRDYPCFFLTRNDLVLQAISLAKMMKTGTAHNVDLDQEILARMDGDFAYDASFIEKQYRRLAKHEQSFETMFKTYDLQPKRLSYEQITSSPGIDIVNMIATHIGEEPIVDCDIVSDQKKLGSSKNEAFAERFRAERADLVAKIEAMRPRN